MKYGDVILAKRRWGKNGIVYPQHTYRFRIDPVPFIYRYGYNFSCWFKKPKSTQERRMSFVCKEYIRGKRSNRNLPNAYDDRRRSDVRTRYSWKKRCKYKKQWGKNV